MTDSVFENSQLDSFGNPIYIIPKGTMLYRGESSVNESTYQLPSSAYPVFFGFAKDDIERNYGITYQFTTKKEIRCIAMDLLNTSSPFYVKSPQRIKDILVENYGLGENMDSKSKIRLSESDNDKKLAKYVCHSGYDGYANPNMNTKFDTFHAEIAICNASTRLNQPGSRVTSSEHADKLKMEHWLIKNAVKKSRRPTQRFSPVKSPIVFSSLFGDSPPGSPKVSPIKFALFETPPKKGGATKKKKSNTKKTLRRKTGKSSMYKL